MFSKWSGFYLFCAVLIAVAAVSEAQWRGQFEQYRQIVYRRCKRCVCRYWWGCSQYRYFSCNYYVTANRCQAGWRHKGDYNCNIPICRPGCGEGVCTSPEVCDCKGLATGRYCQTLTCSYNRPCYPGNCFDNDKCNCLDGFTTKTSSQYGCLKMESTNKPIIGRSTILIQHIRQTDNQLKYYFLVDGTNETATNVVWSNQQLFNRMDFEFEMLYDGPELLPERPAYVHSTEVGITKGRVELRVINFKNEVHPIQRYDHDCDGNSQDNPVQIFNCSIQNEEFKTLIEHADTLKVTFIAENGGLRTLNEQGNLRPREYFDGETTSKVVYFKFDFQAPKHCSEADVSGYTLTTCSDGATIMEVEEEFSKEPITVFWNGWTDDRYGAQMWMYYLELHKLVTKDETKHLTERNPIGPMATTQLLHNGNVRHSHTFTPTEPGIYSILLEARDIANNSRIARRFAVYDKVSDVELNLDSPNGLHVSTAESHTGFKWQKNGIEGQDTQLTLNWTGFFMNKAHEDGHYNNEINGFPVQFENIEDDGILFSKKFVDPDLDDLEGERTLNPIPSKHGIVRFEYQYSRDVSVVLPPGVWQDITPISETVNIIEKLNTGDQIKFWVRASDNIGNNKTATTMVSADFTAPTVSDPDDDSTTYIVLNDNKGPFNFSSRVHLEASDEQSGVTELGIEITISAPDMVDKTVTKTAKANTDDTKHPDRDTTCVPSLDKSTCFLTDQTVYLDNCWLTLPDQTKLPKATAHVIIRAYNQAMLSSSVTYQIDSITDLKGLETYTGPIAARIENVQSGSFRITWDFPEKMSCYAIQTYIIIILYKQSSDGTKTHEEFLVSGSAKFFDVASLDPDTKYDLSFTSSIGGQEAKPLSLSVQTAALPSSGASTGLIVGVAVGVIVLVGLVIIIFIILVRRGYIHPQERARRVRRAVTKKYRQTVYGESGNSHRHVSGMSNAVYDPESGPINRKTMTEQEELYLYGGMDINMPEVQHIDRDDISFEGIIKDGHFARIYKATLRKGRSESTVIAKTLKEKFSTADEMLMRAKINFTGTVVGSHPNVLKFLGAVTGDDQMGPFIIYEYCENGTLKDYLVSQKNNVTIEIQEQLFRFGLDIAKGMEYLASKNIVHRRLAARNILLTFLKEVKISGFGPQPDAEDGGNPEKQERIPIKWMAPECMSSTKDATEKSDVWSYAVVLWEIFTLGETPYSQMKSRQLPMALKKGERLHKPEQCDDTWYDVMKKCWSYDQSKRPVFAELRSELDEKFVAAPGDDYYYYKR